MGDSLTEDTGTIMNKEEVYEVIDECMEVDPPEATDSAKDSCKDLSKDLPMDSPKDSQAEATADPKEDNIVQESPKTVNDNVTSQSNNTDKSNLIKMECSQESNNDSIDFTADISLDQFNGQKDVTDEEVMNHLDIIEGIELDPETFGVDECMKEDNQSFTKEGEEGKEEEKDEVTVIEEEFIEEKWYEKKLMEKNNSLKERLSKLARVLIATYPSYEKWLERIEKIEGTPICKIDPIRRCSLKKPYTNRWKFQCKQKYTEQSVKQENNSGLKTMWYLEQIGIGGANIDNTTELPFFVSKAIKIFEDFLQTTITPTEDIIFSNENLSIKTEIPIKKDVDQDYKQQWSYLLVRCNSKDELMLFATGKNISRSTMDRLKHIFESGPGKNCNVKSLYCKSMNKRDDKIVTTFLVGAEALNETVGTLKVQLAPKTNFWCNAAGAWNVAKAVSDMLEPTQKVTLLEIGCGIGVIGLTLASKCREVIGIDSPSEIEEAEMTCELNNIYNASFIIGSPAEVVRKLSSARDLHNKSRVTYCIVNANTNMGRDIEVMTCLRKITSLRRIVMVTTLTKQSVRAILELARPVENGIGHPFMPIRACVVDTSPTGSHFEIVILMERRLMHRLTQPWFIKMLEEESKTLTNTNASNKNDKIEDVNPRLRKNPLAKPELVEKTKALLSQKITKAVKSPVTSPAKGKMKLKRDHSPDIVEIKKVSKKFEKSGFKPGQYDVTAKKKNWLHENSTLRINPLFDKKARENKEQIDLREKLLSNRIDTDLIQKVNETREILEAAKEKLSGPSPTVDPMTAKELKNVLSIVLDQTNKLQTQLPRSVWDRIAPPEPESKIQVHKDLDDDPLLKGRFVQDIRAQDLVITTPNKEYLETEDIKPKFKKYHNLPLLEPTMAMPIKKKSKPDGNKVESLKKTFDNRNRQQNQDNWNKNKNFNRNRWNDAGFMRKPNSPMKRQDPSFRQRVSPDKYSSKRPPLSPPRRPNSPFRRHLSPDRSYHPHVSLPHQEFSQRRPVSPVRISSSDDRRQMSPARHSFSLFNRMSPPRRLMPDSNRPISPVRPHISPPRSQLSPSRRYISQEYNLFARRPSSERRPISPVGRVSPSRSRDMIPSRHQSPPMRRFSPHRESQHGASPPRRQQSPPRRQNSPPNRYMDEWDIPSRGAIEQSTTWQRSINERPENVWHNERQPSTSGNWQNVSDSDRYQKPANQDKSWNVKDTSSHGNSWNTKQSESWQTSDRWSGPSRSSGENWNRNKDSLDNRTNKELWTNTNKPRWEQSSSNDWNQGDKDDWNDLPEDARDPWGDEGNLGLKERWMNVDNQTTSSANWPREVDKGDLWTKSKDNWQSKSQTFPAKPLCQNSNNPNINDSRWLPPNDMSKKISSSNWQGGSNVGANVWQSNFSFQSQRSFVPNLYKERR